MFDFIYKSKRFEMNSNSSFNALTLGPQNQLKFLINQLFKSTSTSNLATTDHIRATINNTKFHFGLQSLEEICRGNYGVVQTNSVSKSTGRLKS